LEVVRPKMIDVFAIPPMEEKPEDFLNRLAGLCKFAINKREGRATIRELAAAMAAREVAVQIGLDWLGASGELTVTMEEDTVKLTAGKQEKNPYLQAELFVALRGVLNETSAFRKFLASTKDLKGLLNQAS
jgi:hypothetical protein